VGVDVVAGPELPFDALAISALAAFGRGFESWKLHVSSTFFQRTIAVGQLARAALRSPRRSASAPGRETM
jgi:hypothetical protein